MDGHEGLDAVGVEEGTFVDHSQTSLSYSDFVEKDGHQYISLDIQIYLLRFGV